MKFGWSKRLALATCCTAQPAPLRNEAPWPECHFKRAQKDGSERSDNGLNIGMTKVALTNLGYSSRG